MKTLLSLTAAFFITLSAAFAQAIQPSISSLARVLTLTVDGKEYQAGFVENGWNIAFYAVAGMGERDFIQVSRPDDHGDYNVEALIGNRLLQFEVPRHSRASTFSAKVRPIRRGRVEQNQRGVEHWSEYSSTGEDTTLEVGLTRLSGYPGIGTEETVTGPITYSACDGCEHGDQLMIQSEGRRPMKVNLVDLNWGAYYVEDCEGTVHRLLTRLFTDVEEDGTGLGVPFTFKGLINMGTTDLLETVGDFWVADKRQGQVFIGHTTRLPVARWLDSLVHHVSGVLRLQSHQIWDDVLATGQFSVRGDVLVFIYRNAVVETNLRTADVSARSL